MLRVTTTEHGQTLTLKLEGKLAGPWVQEVTRVWQAATEPKRAGYVIDLRSITFIDSTGKALLTLMSRDGAQLLAAGCLTRTIVDQIEREVVSVRR